MKFSMILDIALGVLMGSLALDGVHAVITKLNPPPPPHVVLAAPHVEFGDTGSR